MAPVGQEGTGGGGGCKSTQLQTHSIIITDENGKPKWPGKKYQSKVDRYLSSLPQHCSPKPFLSKYPN